MIRWLLRRNEQLNSISFDNIRSLIPYNSSQALVSAPAISIAFSVLFAAPFFICVCICGCAVPFVYCYVQSHNWSVIWFYCVCKFLFMCFFSRWLYLFVCLFVNEGDAILCFCVRYMECGVMWRNEKQKPPSTQANTSNFESIAHQFKESKLFYGISLSHRLFRKCESLALFVRSLLWLGCGSNKT